MSRPLPLCRGTLLFIHLAVEFAPAIVSQELDATDRDHAAALIEFSSHFVNMTRTHRPASAIILDVGANDGQWTQSVQKLLRHRSVFGSRQAARNKTQLHLFEPQPRFATDLQRVVEGWPHATVHEAAAWTDDARNLTLHLSRLSVAASLLPIVAHHSGLPRYTQPNISVRAVNLATFLSTVLPDPPNASQKFVVFKLDVEAAEFELLPHLLVTGVLCRVYLLVLEWHLNALPPHERLAGLGLRLSLSTQLRTGCRSFAANAPVTVHEGAAMNNREQRVPGLWDVALQHNGTPIGPAFQPSRGVKKWQLARQTLERQQSPSGPE